MGVDCIFPVLIDYTAMSQNRFWNLLAKNLSGDAQPGEVVELQQLCKEHPEWVYAASHVESLWKLQPKENDGTDADNAFALHLERQSENGLDLTHMDVPTTVPDLIDKPSHRKTKQLRSFSIGLVVFFGIGGLLWNLTSKKVQDPFQNKSISEVSTRLGNKTKLVLPDSSIVWLNAGSRLTYNEQFGISNRHTTLSGEAYFQVEKSTVPFTIHTGTVNITVLGTVFNVKSYPNEKTETTLIHGRVEVTLDQRPGEKFVLKPNEKLIVANNIAANKQLLNFQKKEPLVVLSELTHTIDQGIVETSWVDNKLVFQDESFLDMARKMERWYNVTIEIPDQKIALMRVTGTFENETVRQALDALKIAFKFSYTIQQNKITITQ